MNLYTLLIFVFKNFVAVASGNNFNKISFRFIVESPQQFIHFVNNLRTSRYYFERKLFRFEISHLENTSLDFEILWKIDICTEGNCSKNTRGACNPDNEIESIKTVFHRDVKSAAMLMQCRARHESCGTFRLLEIERGVAECRHDKSCETRRGWAVPGSLSVKLVKVEL